MLLVLFYMGFMLVNIYWCSSGWFMDFCFSISFRLYHGQALMICTILFARLVSIFQATAFKIGKHSIAVYTVITVLIFALWTCGNILFYEPSYEQIGLVLIGLSGLCYVIGMVLLNALFIHKLMSVRKSVKDQQSNSKDDDLLNVITKIAILCLASTVSTFAFLSLFTFRKVWNSVYYRMSVSGLLITDIYTNYLSILLSFKRFNTWYLCLCGCCDRKCHSFWEYCVNGKMDVGALQEIVLQTSDPSANTKNANPCKNCNISPPSLDTPKKINVCSEK